MGQGSPDCFDCDIFRLCVAIIAHITVANNTDGNQGANANTDVCLSVRILQTHVFSRIVDL